MAGTDEVDEVPTSKSAICHIDFEFQIKYDERLNKRDLLLASILEATNAMLQTDITISADNVAIPEIDLKPDESSPRFIKVAGWLTCKSSEKDEVMVALEAAKTNKKLSKTMAAKAGVKPNRVAMMQFKLRFSTGHRVLGSYIPDTEANFNEFKKRMAAESQAANANTVDEQKTADGSADTTADTTMTTTASGSDNDNDDDDNGEGDDDDDAPPLAVNSSVRVDALMRDEDNVVAEENMAEPQKETVHSEDAEADTAKQFQKALQVAEDYQEESESGSGNEKEAEDDLEPDDGEDEEFQDDSNPYSVSVTGPTHVVEDSTDDYSGVTPRLPTTTVADEIKEQLEMEKLQLEVQKLKQQHAEQEQFFNNKITVLQGDRDKQRSKAKLSMQVDEEIVKKKLATDRDAHIKALEQKITEMKRQESLEMQQLKVQHSRTVEKLTSKLRQREQLHQMELKNITDSHSLERDQLAGRVKVLEGAEKREQEAKRKVTELEQDNEHLRSDKARTVQRYDDAISRLNEEAEEAQRREIDERVANETKFKRQIQDLQRQLERQADRISQADQVERQLKKENADQTNMIEKMRTMLVKERKKCSRLERKLRGMGGAKKEEESGKGKGGKGQTHKRVDSHRLKDRTVTLGNMDDSGARVITVATKTGSDLDLLKDLGIADEDLSESDGDGGDVVEEDTKLIAQDTHDEEMRLRDSQIAALREKVRNLESNMQVLRNHTSDELEDRNRQIGALQSKVEAEHEHFMKKSQLLEYQLTKNEKARGELDDQLHDAQRKLKRETQRLNNEIAAKEEEIAARDRDIDQLVENIQLLEQKVGAMQQYEEDIEQYEEELKEIDEHYQDVMDEMKAENEERQQQLNALVREKEKENKTLNQTVNRHSQSIQELQAMIDTMSATKHDIADKQSQLRQIMKKTASKRNLAEAVGGPGQVMPSVSEGNEGAGVDAFQVGGGSEKRSQRESREMTGAELDQLNLSDEESGRSNRSAGDRARRPSVEEIKQRRRDSVPLGPVQTEADVQAKAKEAEVDLSLYMLRSEVDETVMYKVERKTARLKEDHALEIKSLMMDHVLAKDTATDKLKRELGQKYEKMEKTYKRDQERLMGDIERLQLKHEQIMDMNNMLMEEKAEIKEQLDTKIEKKEEQIAALKEKMQRRDEERKGEVKRQEESRVALLERFMSEMDRLRDEIRELHGMNRMNRLNVR